MLERLYTMINEKKFLWIRRGCLRLFVTLWLWRKCAEHTATGTACGATN